MGERKELWRVSWRQLNAQPGIQLPFISLARSGLMALPKEGQEVYLTMGREGTDLGISLSCINGYKSICFLVVSFYLFLSLLNFLKVKDNSRTWFDSGLVILARALHRLVYMLHIASYQEAPCLIVVDSSSSGYHFLPTPNLVTPPYIHSLG